MQSSEQVKCVTRHKQGEESIQEGLQKLPGAKRSHWRSLSRRISQSDILKDSSWLQQHREPDKLLRKPTRR